MRPLCSPTVARAHNLLNCRPGERPYSAYGPIGNTHTHLFKHTITETWAGSLRRYYKLARTYGHAAALVRLPWLLPSRKTRLDKKLHILLQLIYSHRKTKGASSVSVNLDCSSKMGTLTHVLQLNQPVPARAVSWTNTLFSHFGVFWFYN